jgi:NodT family efflux transporter outer membrane factor (OMF) lipoprotein
LAGCAVGPRYSRPSAPAAPAYQETAPNWKTAQPADQFARGKWWEIFQDPPLNLLEERADMANQTVKAAQARFVQARALVRLNRSNLYPTATAGVSATRNRLSANRAVQRSAAQYNDFVLPVDVSYEPDLWGRVRRNLENARASAQASAGDLQSIRLSVEAEVAADYFQLRTFDLEEQLLNQTVAAYRKALELTQNRYRGGVASGVDVAQSQTQLQSTLAQAQDVQVARSQLQYAIATLTGVPASSFSLAAAPLRRAPPAIPPGVPSQLLERRPDIAAAERRAAAASANIGAVKAAAYFPLLSVTASGGFESVAAGTWFTGPSAFATAGASAVATIFDVGRRRAQVEEARALYDQAVADYRQTVLDGFQEVEDNLASSRILEQEAITQAAAVQAARQSVALSTNRYKGGVATYLEVITAQTAELANERAEVDVLRRRMTAAVVLVKALGGGWNASQLPAGNMLSSSGPGSHP